MAIDPADIAAMREQGDLKDYLLSLSGRVPSPQPAVEPKAADPGYQITHTGGWPLGSAATGPTPDPARCSCIRCAQPAPVTPLTGPPVEHRHEGEAA